MLRETGRRADEILSLNVGDVSLQAGREVLRLNDTKNNEDQVVVLTTDVMPRTIRGLRSWLRELGDVRPSEPLFRGKHGGRLAYRSLHEQWNHLCARLNLLDQGRPQYTIHQLRHTFGTEKIAQHPEQLVARMMGHRDVRSTRQYAQVNDEQVRVALSRKQR
jgi:integrase/recombinase XerD